MTEEEREEMLNLAFPSIVQGYVRGETVESDFPFSDTFPPFVAKDLVIYSLNNLVIRQMLSNDKWLKSMLNSTITQIENCDLRLVNYEEDGIMSSADKIKLDGIEDNANNYVHPASGVLAGSYKQVVVDANGHVTGGTNPTTLAGYGITDAAYKNHGNHVPATETANSARFLRNDNTWQNVTPVNIGAAPIASPTFTGTVTAPTLSVTSALYLNGYRLYIA